MPGLSLKPLLVVILSCPLRIGNRVQRPLMKRLPQKLGTGPSPVNPPLFAAAGNHRRDAAAALNFMGGLIPVALSTEGRDQPWRQRRARRLETNSSGRNRDARAPGCRSVRQTFLSPEEAALEDLPKPPRPRCRMSRPLGPWSPGEPCGSAPTVLECVPHCGCCGPRKKRSMVDRLARCSASRVGQRSRKSAAMLQPISSNQSSTYGKYIFRCAVSRFEYRVFSWTSFRRSSTRNCSVRVWAVSGFSRRSLSR